MDAVLSHLLDAAGRAPSAHNTQPWVLRPRGTGELEVGVRTGRTLPAADPTGADTLHSVGAMLENLLITLAHLGCAAEYEVIGPVASDAPVLRVRWLPAGGSPPAPDRNGDPAVLYRMIPIRRTSRLPYDAAPIAPEILVSLRAAVRSPGALYALTEAQAIGEVRALVAAATAVQLAEAPVARELYDWLRFSPRDRRWYRDGLNAACMGWRSWEAAVIRLLLAPSVLPILSRWGLHRALCADVDQQAPPAPALCLLTVAEESVTARIEAGRMLQRVWLTAAVHGLVTHPLSAAVDVASTRPQVLARFGVPAGQSHVNLFRLGRSAPPARSPRLPADEILDAPD